MKELVTFKLEQKFLQEVDQISKDSGFSNRTDFIRNALREKIEDIKIKEAVIRVSKLRGKSNKKTTDAEIHAVREKAVNELLKKKGFA